MLLKFQVRIRTVNSRNIIYSARAPSATSRAAGENLQRSGGEGILAAGVLKYIITGKSTVYTLL